MSFILYFNNALYKGIQEETGCATPFLCQAELEADVVDKNYGTLSSYIWTKLDIMYSFP